MLWVPTKSLGVHVIEWEPKTQILGVQALWLGSHVNVWRLTKSLGAHLNRMTVQSDATLSAHVQFADIQRNKAWAPKHVSKVTHFWASTDIQDGPPQHNSWTLTLRLGHPRIVVDGRTQSWVATIYFGHPGVCILATHATLWASMYLCEWPHVNCAPTHCCVGVRGIWVDCHAFKWAPITISWTSTKRAWLATENMWRVTHLVGWPQQVDGGPRNRMEAHTRCVAYGHTLRWPHVVWVDGRDMGACGGAHAKCGHPLCKHGRVWAPTRK